jgi:hypothetical protein
MLGAIRVCSNIATHALRGPGSNSAHQTPKVFATKTRRGSLNKVRGLSPRAMYTDRAKLVPTFADRGVAWSGQRIHTAVFSVF